MAAIHVFAIDWVPQRADIASGGGLRSLQVIETLRNAGHQVTYSVPGDCRHIRRLGADHRSLRAIEVHTPANQIDLLRRLRPQIVFWLAPLIRTIPLTGSGDLIHVCDVLGLPHVEAAIGAPGVEARNRERLVGLCAPADLVLTGSDEQHGYWLAELSRDRPPPPTAVVPYALPAALRDARRTAARATRMRRLHVTGMVYAWSTSVELLDRIAHWVGRRQDVTLLAIVGADPGGATDQTVLRRLQAIAARPRVDMPGEVSFGAAMAGYGPGSLSLDIYEPNLERRMAVPIRTVNALTYGVPVLSTVDGTLTRRLVAEGAGLLATDRPDVPIEAALDRAAGLSAAAFARMSDAARRFADQHYAAATAGAALLAALDQAVDRHQAARRAWIGYRPVAASRPPHVLVISNVRPHHRELRVEVPFGALFGQQRIGGYSVWSHGEFAFTTSSSLTTQDFDAIWVQREIPPEVAVALGTLQRPFVYDIDDNLLATPGFRPPFPIESVQTVRNLIWSCTVLSCATARLGHLLQTPAVAWVADKVMVTPNLLREPPAPRPHGTPRFVVWVSSDAPALTRSRTAVIQAIRDFCLSSGTPLVCIGAEPPDLLAESAIEITHLRQVPYGPYLSLLRSFAPAIMACPLEADDEPGPASFTDAKSDIKILEALAGGLVGVFSRARPYLDSDLPHPVLCDNSYAGWMDGLRQAWRLCARRPEPMVIPGCRLARDTGPRPWLDAVNLVRLRNPLGFAEFSAALALLRGRYGRRLLSPAEFDETFYLNTYADVQAVVSQGFVASAYDHYRADGFREGRAGRPNDVVEPHNEHYWANLLHTIGDLGKSVEALDYHLESLKARRATRLKLRRFNGY